MYAAATRIRLVRLQQVAPFGFDHLLNMALAAVPYQPLIILHQEKRVIVFECVGNTIRCEDIRKGCLNLIVSSCGTGKSYWCANNLLEEFPGIRPEEVIFLTSRSIAVDQQVNDYENLIKFDQEDPIVNFWCGSRDIDSYADGAESFDGVGKIRIMTYDKLGSLFYCGNNKVFYHKALENVKIIILDEVHALCGDGFIKELVFFQAWLHFTLKCSEKIVIGLTATPGILYDSAEDMGICLNYISEPLQRYKVKKLWCTDIYSMVDLVNNKLDGKTIIMCKTVRGAYGLKKIINNSVVLAGKSGSDYIASEMDYVRNSLVKNYTLPRNVKVLISTSTIREGFTIKEDSGIKNVVCLYSDEMDIHQFVGRCRYDVDNLIVASRGTEREAVDYIASQEEMFIRYCDTLGEDDSWFSYISDIMSDPDSSAEFVFCKNHKKFKYNKKPKASNPKVGLYRTKDSKEELIKYINNNLISDDTNVKHITSDMANNVILPKIGELKIFSDEFNSISWNQICNIASELGFRVETGRAYIDRSRTRYRAFYKENGDQ